MESLASLVPEYLRTLGFGSISQHDQTIVASRLAAANDRETWVVLTLTPDQTTRSYEPTLRGRLRRLRIDYPYARVYLLSDARTGFSAELRKELREDYNATWTVPIWFFDAPLLIDQGPQLGSAISHLSTADPMRVPQPYEVSKTEGPSGGGSDLLPILQEELKRLDHPAIRIVVGQAGIGKSILFTALFGNLYDKFLGAKRRQQPFPRPIPLIPHHLRAAIALRAEALIDAFIHTDVGSIIPRQTFQWLLTRGYTTWMLDGLGPVNTT